MKFWRLSFGFLAYALVVAGCSDGRSPGSDRSMASVLSSSFQPSQQRALELRVEQEVALCMRSRGWDYVPTEETVPGDGEIADVVSETHGYGVVLRLQLDVAQEEKPDPNAMLVEALNDNERAAYFRDLDSEPGAQYESSCRYLGERAATQGLLLARPDVRQRIAELHAAVWGDRDVVKALVAWRTCMVDVSPDYHFSTPDEIVASIEDRALEVLLIPDGMIPASERERRFDAIAGTELSIWKADRLCAERTKLDDAVRAAEMVASGLLLDEFPEIATVADPSKDPSQD